MNHRSIRLIDDREIWGKEPDLAALRQAHKLLKADPRQALTKLEQLAMQGSVMSMVYIGSAYRRGDGVIRDDSQAERWFARASESGSILASHELGKLFLHKGKYSEAANLFSHCGELNFSPSLCQLAVLHLNGDGVPKDIAKSRMLFEAAATQGNILAKRNLAINLIKGRFGKREILRGLCIYVSALPAVFETALRDPYSSELRS